jgi:Fe-S cluster biogenesis protein NfuA
VNRRDEAEFQAQMARVEMLVELLEQSADAEARAHAQELMKAVLDLHGAGLARILGRLSDAGVPGQQIAADLARDELVVSLLLLHGLHPLELASRVEKALDAVRPQLRSHGGEVELVGIADGVVRLRLQGNCHGCPSSSLTMKHLIEEAIVKEAPDAAAVEVAGAVEPTAAFSAGFMSLDQLSGQGRLLSGANGEDRTVVGIA